jgi:hypothetical protein
LSRSALRIGIDAKFVGRLSKASCMAAQALSPKRGDSIHAHGDTGGQGAASGA